MNSIYNTQKFKLIVDTGMDLQTATGLDIMYKAPDGVTGTWAATLDTSTRSRTRMYYDGNTLNKTGKWYVFARVTFIDGIIPGKLSYFNVYPEPF